MKKNCWTLVVKTRLLWFYLAWFPYDHYHRCDRCDRWAKQSSSIVAITEWSYGNHFLAIAAIAATTIAEIELFLSQQSLSLRSLESGFHMIAIIAALAELLFFSAITAMVAIIWKPSFREPEKLHISAFCSPLNPGFHMIGYDRYDRCDRWKVFSI